METELQRLLLLGIPHPRREVKRPVTLVDDEHGHIQVCFIWMTSRHVQ